MTLDVKMQTIQKYQDLCQDFCSILLHDYESSEDIAEGNADCKIYAKYLREAYDRIAKYSREDFIAYYNCQIENCECLMRKFRSAEHREVRAKESLQKLFEAADKVRERLKSFVGSEADIYHEAQRMRNEYCEFFDQYATIAELALYYKRLIERAK